MLTFTRFFAKIIPTKKRTERKTFMKRMIGILLLLGIAASLLSMPSCSKSGKGAYSSRTFYTYFDTVGTFYDYNGMKKSEFEALADRVEEELRVYHELYDIYNEYDGLTNIATLNEGAGGGAVKAVAVGAEITVLLLGQRLGTQGAAEQTVHGYHLPFIMHPWVKKGKKKTAERCSLRSGG